MQGMEVFTGVVQVDDVDGLGEVFLDDGSVVGRSIGEGDEFLRPIQSAA